MGLGALVCILYFRNQEESSPVPLFFGLHDSFSSRITCRFKTIEI